MERGLEHRQQGSVEVTFSNAGAEVTTVPPAHRAGDPSRPGSRDSDPPPGAGYRAMSRPCAMSAQITTMSRAMISRDQAG